MASYVFPSVAVSADGAQCSHLIVGSTGGSTAAWTTGIFTAASGTAITLDTSWYWHENYQRQLRAEHRAHGRYQTPITNYPAYHAVEYDMQIAEGGWEPVREVAVVGPHVMQPNDRAKDLFLSVITAEQRAEFERSGYIHVTARSGRRYRVNCAANRHGNILELSPDGQQQLASLCVSPSGPIPHFDAILGQIIALQHDETALREAANFTPLVHGYDRHRPPALIAA